MEEKNKMSQEEAEAEIARIDKLLDEHGAQWEKQEIHEIDIDKAQSAMKFMVDYVEHNPEGITKAEVAAKEALMGLILTAVLTGLIPNATKQTTEFRAKIFMAFDIGYVYGRLSGKPSIP